MNDDNSGFSISDLGFTDDNNNNSNNSINYNNNIPGINGGFTSSDLNNNENTNNLSYDFSNMSNSNNSTFLNNGLNVENNISTGSGANSLINVITDDSNISNNSNSSNSIFNRPKEEEVFNVPPDLEGGFNSPPPVEEGEFIVPPNFSNTVAPPVESNLVNVQPSQPIQNPNQNPSINLINTYQEEDDDDDDSILSLLFPNRKKKKKNQNINNNNPGFNVKNRVLREKNIFTDVEVFKSFSKVVVDVVVFIVVAIMLYKLYVKENANVVKKLPKDANQYTKVCTVDRPFNDTVNMSGAFGIYEYGGNLYLDEVVLWSARTGTIKIPEGQTENEVIANFTGLSGASIGIEKGTIVASNNYYKKPGMVFTSQSSSYPISQYTINILVQKFVDYGANCN